MCVVQQNVLLLSAGYGFCTLTRQMLTVHTLHYVDDGSVDSSVVG